MLKALGLHGAALHVAEDHCVQLCWPSAGQLHPECELFCNASAATCMFKGEVGNVIAATTNGNSVLFNAGRK